MSVDKELEILLKYYEINRNAIMARVTLRDNVIMIYLGGVSAIFGAAIQSNNYLFLFIIPFLSLGVSAIVSNHQYFISSHVWYSINEIGRSLAELGVKSKQWESFLGDLNKTERRTRSIGDLLYILLPSIIAVGINYKNFYSLWGIFLCAVVSIAISLFLLLSALGYRRRIMISTKTPNSNQKKS